MGFIEPGKSLRRRNNLKKRPNQSKKANKVIKSTHSKISTRDVVGPASHEEYTLDKLPPEVLFRIFVLTGLEKNGLPLTSKYFNQLFKFKERSSEIWNNLSLVESIMNNHFVYNLNKNLNLDSLEERLHKYIDRNPESHDDRRVIKQITALQIFKKLPRALDKEFFKYKFVSSQLLDVLERRGLKVLDISQIEEEIRERPKFIKALSDDIITDSSELVANPVDDATNNTAIEENEEHEQANIWQNNNEFNYNTLRKTADFPDTFYSNGLTGGNTLLLAKTLNSKFDLNFLQVNKILHETAKNFDNKTNVSLLEVTQFLVNINKFREKIETSSIIEYFKIAERFKDSKNELFKRDIMESIDILLTLFYSDTHMNCKDNELWLFIIEVKNFDLFQSLMKFNDNPNHDILHLMSV